VVHIIDTHVDQLQDLVTKLEMELDSVELDLDKGTSHYSLIMTLTTIIIYACNIPS
jgi:hypothetical protein